MAKRHRTPAAREDGCPCGGESFESCCGPVIGDPSTASTPIAIMRSRYTAHVKSDLDHLAATWHRDHRPAEMAHDPDVRWLGLDILDAPDPDDGHGTVEFVARFRRGKQSSQLHERSRFVLVDNRWLYTNGDLQHDRP